MRVKRRFRTALACAYASSASVAFVPSAGTRCPGTRHRRGLETSTSRVSHGSRSSFGGSPVLGVTNTARPRSFGRAKWQGRGRQRSSLGMFLGGTDTILGVGSPEVVVILIIGYFVLGPVELFKLAKQAGVLAGQLKDLGLGTATNLSKIMDEQIVQAEKIASGQIPSGYYDPEQEYPAGEDDEFEEVTVDEFGRIVTDPEGRPSQTPADDEKPFWDGWDGDSLGLNGGEGPLKEASKFASQISGAVNKKVMDMSDADLAAADGAEAWPGAQAAGAAAAGVDIAKSWKPPTNEMGMSPGLGSDVPDELEVGPSREVTSDLSIDEQFERLDTIAALEQERATTMQRLEAKIEEKIGSIKTELLQLVDEDFQDRRANVDREFEAKRKAKAAATTSATPASATKVSND